MGEEQHTAAKMVGPIIRGTDAELAEAIIAAIEEDNRGKTVEVIDRGGYIRIQVEWECRLTRASLESELGSPYPLSLIESVLTAFAGRMKTTDDQLIWCLERRETGDADS
ncbi:MmoB/DmpM family protein [Streptomyces shenzhenensis]